MSGRGALHNRWSGGRTEKQGYIGIFMPDHPRAMKERDRATYVLEHILVAEAAVGRFLFPPIEIHHVNGVRSDNRPENLVVCPDREYHKLLHRRANILRLGGDPTHDKICGTCKLVTPRLGFSRSRNAYDGLMSRCRRCVAVAWKADAPRRAKRLLAAIAIAVVFVGCAHHPGLYQVKPPLKPPPVRPQFTSPLQTAESRWILDVVKWGEYHCREVAAMNGLGDPAAFCRVQ